MDILIYSILVLSFFSAYRDLARFVFEGTWPKETVRVPVWIAKWNFDSFHLPGGIRTLIVLLLFTYFRHIPVWSIPVIWIAFYWIRNIWIHIIMRKGDGVQWKYLNPLHWFTDFIIKKIRGQ